MHSPEHASSRPQQVGVLAECLRTVLGFWNLVWSLGPLHMIWTDSEDYAFQFSAFGATLGIVYLAAAFIQLLGIFAATRLRRRMALQVDALFSVLSTALIIGAAMLRVVVHTALKRDIIGECTVLASGHMVQTRIGIWGPHMGAVLAPRFAAVWCTREWSRNSTFEIISLMAAVSALLVIISVLNGVQKGVQQVDDMEGDPELGHDEVSSVVRPQIPAKCCEAMAARSDKDDQLWSA